ncbi:unnamed protein product [Nippostrongylus brasiliensis]|uniref:Ribosomal protein L2 n=1 Tax=Nippostrongylus brasiliensis TaxID=27835 RepID=A0A0N4YRZ2_NIPBR|nr:unnamed protein product [Nippostrongylus brasiliensis]
MLGRRAVQKTKRPTLARPSTASTCGGQKRGGKSDTETRKKKMSTARSRKPNLTRVVQFRLHAGGLRPSGRSLQGIISHSGKGDIIIIYGNVRGYEHASTYKHRLVVPPLSFEYSTTTMIFWSDSVTTAAQYEQISIEAAVLYREGKWRQHNQRW